VELPEESLAHHHRRASHHHVSVRLALHNLPDQRLLPNIRKHYFPNTGSDSQRRLRDLISINRHLPLPWNETNPDFARTGSPGKEEGSAAENTKAAFTVLDLAAEDY